MYDVPTCYFTRDGKATEDTCHSFNGLFKPIETPTPGTYCWSLLLGLVVKDIEKGKVTRNSGRSAKNDVTSDSPSIALFFFKVKTHGANDITLQQGFNSGA